MPKIISLVTPTEVSREMVKEWVENHPFGALDTVYGGRFTQGDAIVWIDLDTELFLFDDDDIEEARLALGSTPCASIQLTIRYDEGSERLSKEIMEQMKAKWGGLTNKEIWGEDA